MNQTQGNIVTLIVLLVLVHVYVLVILVKELYYMNDIYLTVL